MAECTNPSPGKRREAGAFFYLLVAAYLVIHLKFEYEFWLVPDANLFQKFAASDGASPANVAEKAYLAKSTWFLLTILLVTFRVPFRLAIGIGSMIYGLELLLLFGSIWIAWGTIALGGAVIFECSRCRARRKVIEQP